MNTLKIIRLLFIILLSWNTLITGALIYQNTLKNNEILQQEIIIQEQIPVPELELIKE